MSADGIPSSRASTSTSSTAVEEARRRFAVEWFDYAAATEEEKKQIGEVYRYVFEHDIQLTFDPSLDADFVDPLKYYGAANRGAFLVVRDLSTPERKIVGTAGLRHLKELGNEAELKRMFLLPLCRGAKLGFIMARMVMERARQLQYDAIVLDTKKRLAAANRVYEVLGWTDCENYNGNPRADRFMRLRLTVTRPSSKL